MKLNWALIAGETKWDLALCVAWAPASHQHNLVKHKAARKLNVISILLFIYLYIFLGRKNVSNG